MSSIELVKLENSDELLWPNETNAISLLSSAINVFTDFRLQRPLVLEQGTCADDALSLMKRAHVRLKLIVDGKNHLLGVLSSYELSERKIVKKVAQGFERESLTVDDFMIAKGNIRAIEYEALRHSNIQGLLEFFKNSEQQHCLVKDSNQSKVRGLISASDIGKKLGIDFDVSQGISFLSVYKQLSKRTPNLIAI